MRIHITVLLSGILAFCIRSVSAVNIEMVTVGNPGNAPYEHPEFLTTYGSVGYVYQIGKYEVTNAQYTEFLNAVGRDGDPYSLYPTDYSGYSYPFVYNPFGIQRDGSYPDYSYSVAPQYANLPVAWVSFWQAVAFCNWLHNGQPTGQEGPGTTADGAYDVLENNICCRIPIRNPNAKFFLPTVSEWDKAAYHNKAAGLAADYFDYPTGTNDEPRNTLPDLGNHANFYDPNNPQYDGYTIGPPYTTNVGSFVNSPSPYGTFDQGGNLEEWTESGHDSQRTVIGGGFSFPSYSLHIAHNTNGADMHDVSSILGFRIAAAAPVPEPTCLALFSIAAMMLGGSRSRMQRA